jgi:prolipoprotein diacylglyceryltransferase
VTIPFEPIIFGVKINVHLIIEYLAFFIALQYYRRLRKVNADQISDKDRLSIVLGAIIGAFFGSRLIAFLENPMIAIDASNVINLLTNKSIMGGLFGGLLGVEAAKKIIHVQQSSGDLFTYPIIVGIAIGRVGCFLSGVKEFTYGNETRFFSGMDLGDGVLRHPAALYEVIFLGMLFLILKKITPYTRRENGLLFKIFMLTYFGFRFVLEFLKPNTFLLLELSSIQWLCIICWLYYASTLKKIITHAY